MNSAIIVSFLASTLLQLIIFTLVPFIFFLFRGERRQGFFYYVGIRSCSFRPVLPVFGCIILLFSAASLVIYLDANLLQTVRSPNSVQGQIQLLGPGPTGIVVLLLTAWLKTALAEEIFFRGFLGKSLVQTLGFGYGNAIQAILFGSMHGLLFGTMTHASFLSVGFIFIFTSVTGWLLGYMAEKKAGGSILPGCLAHGAANTTSYYIFSFIV